MPGVKSLHLKLNTLPDYGKSLGKAGKTTATKVDDFAKQFPWKPLGYVAAVGLAVPVAIIGVLPWIIVAAISAGVIGSSYIPYKVYTAIFKKNGPFSHGKEEAQKSEDWKKCDPMKETEQTPLISYARRSSALAKEPIPLAQPLPPQDWKPPIPSRVSTPVIDNSSGNRGSSKNNDQVNIASVIAKGMQSQQNSARFLNIQEKEEEFDENENSETEGWEWELPDEYY